MNELSRSAKLIKWLTLPLLILFFAVPTMHARVVGANTVAFTDVTFSDPSSDGITYLQQNGVIHGYSDGSFKSTNRINRAEFLKIVVASLEGFNPDEDNGRECFSDVKDEWFAKYICYAKDNGIVSGYSDGTFRPANNINFAEASKIVVNAFDMETASVKKSDPWYRTFVEPLAGVKAIPESISDLDKFIARGEMAEVVYRIKDEQKEKTSLNYFDLEGVPVSGQSCAALDKLFQDSSSKYRYGGGLIMEDDAPMSISESVSDSADSGTTAAPQAVSNRQKAGGESSDFSETNVQVKGVDEADIVKNDGRYIYLVTGNEVRIVDAYPAETMKEVAKFQMKEFNATPTQLYLNGDQLIVIGDKWGYNDVYPMVDEGNTVPVRELWNPNFHSNRTVVEIYDLSNIAEPKISRRLEFDGNSQHSRRVGETMYLVLNQSHYGYYGMPEVYDPQILLPRFNDSVDKVLKENFLTECEDIMYFPRTRNLNYVIAVAIPLDATDEIVSEVMLGNSENIYASRDSLYIASRNYDDINTYYRDWDNAKTLVYRYSLTPGEIEYKSRGKVPGTILNQFSMDESKEFFRIATTKGSIWGTGENLAKNNLYILNPKMEIVGKIEDVAPGEKIYSTRFMGDRGYMVTFKNVDPLFAFDLSDPYNPTILGQLKIPGYSDYLHPYDENHIIGFGKDAVEAKPGDMRENFAWYQGMKIAVFDVRDPKNPKQLFTELIGDRGTQSPLLYDHKALLFNKEKNLLAFPVTVAEVPGGQDESNPDAYGRTVFDGAYVYNLDLQNGFRLRGKISHYSKDDEAYLKQGSYWYGDHLKSIQRILYIGQNLYTVAEGGIKASDIRTTKEKNYLELQPTLKYDDIIYEEEEKPGGILRLLLP